MPNDDALGRNAKVLVLGGSGFYGSYLVIDLLRFTDANITVASRNPSSFVWNNSNRLQITKCDISDQTAIGQLAAGFDVIVHCAGPFQALPLHPLRAAIWAKANYIDISEDRVFHGEVKRMEKAIREAGITVLSGMSVAPAMEILFADLMKDCFDSLISVRTFAAPDTRKHRGRAMFHTMLLGVGRQFMQPKDGAPRKVWGWTEPEWMEFPPPMGKRLTHLVLEMADLDLLPELFGVKTVEFKAGTEWIFLNRLLSLAAWVRKITGHPNWENFTSPIRMFSWLMGRLGRDEGGVIFEMSGILNGSSITHRVAVTARKDGGLIPSVLASIATRKLMHGGLQTGLLPLNKWIDSDELVGELIKRNLEVWWKPHNAKQWRPFDFIDFKQYVVSR